MRLLLEQFRTLLKEGLEAKEVINRVSTNVIEIIENAKPQRGNKTPLKKVQITEVPSHNNLWIIQSEISDIAGLRNENKTVEKTVLYLKKDCLYAFMIELKSKITYTNLGKFQAKCASSLVQLFLFLAVNEDFTCLKGVELKPVGVLCFNANNVKKEVSKGQWHEEFKNDPEHQICWDFLKLDCSVQFPAVADVMLEPFMLKEPLIMPCLFFQNPSHTRSQESQSDNFDIPFSKLLAF